MRNPRNLTGGVAAIAVAVAASLTLTAPAAGAATGEPVRAAAEQTGWLRLGHFSPDTKAVDVRVTAVRGGSVLLELSDVAYGDISPYQQLAEGSYTISMVAAGSGDWSNVALSDTVEVDSAEASTVAAYGPSKSLQLRAFPDDLTTPAAGNARIRLIQASTITPTVDVMTSTGVAIARAAQPGTATPYAEVPAGDWNLQLTGQGVSDTADVSVAAGSVSTLFVLDNAEGGLTILPVLDSAASPTTPVGGVQTGGGWLASLPGAGAPRSATPAHAV